MTLIFLVPYCWLVYIMFNAISCNWNHRAIRVHQESEDWNFFYSFIANNVIDRAIHYDLRTPGLWDRHVNAFVSKLKYEYLYCKHKHFYHKFVK